MKDIISRHLRDKAHELFQYIEASESPYLNIPIYQNRIDPADPSWMINQGPPSMYNGLGEDAEIKNKKDMHRQGPRPTPVDPLHREVEFPVTETIIGEPREDLQGGPWNDTTTPNGRNEDRDTIGFNPGELDGDPLVDKYA